MPVIDAFGGWDMAELVEEVADIMQQGCGDEGGWVAGGLGEHGGLQGMLALGDAVQTVAGVGAMFQQIVDLGYPRVGGIVHRN